jgi:hypothetical protein
MASSPLTSRQGTSTLTECGLLCDPYEIYHPPTPTTEFQLPQMRPKN